jgi:hypothetical protein
MRPRPARMCPASTQPAKTRHGRQHGTTRCSASGGERGLAGLGVMSIAWMAVIAVPVLARKLLPAKTATGPPLALAIAGLGVLVVITPSLAPRLSPPMCAVTADAGQARAVGQQETTRKEGNQ